MAEHRPFPPSPRRRALARQAGLHAASPLVTGAAAATAALLAAGALAPRIVDQLGHAIVAAVDHAGRPEPTQWWASPTPAATKGSAATATGRPATETDAPATATDAPAEPTSTQIDAPLVPDALPRTVIALVLPILTAAALAALLAHLVQTRAAWLPRRRVDGAPALAQGSIARVRRAGGELASAVALAGVAFGWLWWMAPRLAALWAIGPLGPSAARHAPALPGVAPATPDIAPAVHAVGHAAAATSPLLAAAAALLVSLAVALALAWLALGVIDALVRHAALRRALGMTSTEKREDDRLAGADPRWRARRAAVLRGPRAADAMASASLLILGDDTAVAIVWDPRRRPIPLRVATGRGPRATQLLGLARRHRVAVHRDPALAAALVDGDGPVPEPHWPRLAEVIAATRSATRDASRGRAPPGDAAARDPL